MRRLTQKQALVHARETLGGVLGVLGDGVTANIVKNTLEATEKLSTPRPVAWLHSMTYETGEKRFAIDFNPSHPWGIPGVNFSADFKTKSEPLFK